MNIQRNIVLTISGVSVVMFFRFVTAGEIRTRAEFFEPFITGLSNATVDQVCKYTYNALRFKPLCDLYRYKFLHACVIFLSMLKSSSNKNSLMWPLKSCPSGTFPVLHYFLRQKYKKKDALGYFITAFTI